MKRLTVLLGVAGVSLSAVFVRWATAPSLVLVFYRMAFSLLLLAPLAAARRTEFRALRRRELCLSLLSGAFLGVHFSCYFESLRWTSIAAAVVLAFGGSAAVALAGASAGAGALRGNLFALAGAVCMAVYTLLGAACRRTLSTTVYTSLAYLSAAGTVLAAALAGGWSLTGWGPVNLLAGLGMAVFCTLLGHSVFSWGLKYLSPAFVSTAHLLEPVLAAVWGRLLFGERPGLPVILGGGVILLGIALYSREEA